MLLDLSMPVPERHRRSDLRAKRRKFDNPLYPCLTRRLDHADFVLDLTRVVGARKKYTVYTSEGAAHRRSICEVAARAFDAVAKQACGLVRIPRKGANGHAAVL